MHPAPWLFTGVPLRQKYKVPALYFSNYTTSIVLVDKLYLVRPEQSYRADEDTSCQTALNDDTAAYIVYTIEEGDDR